MKPRVFVSHSTSLKAELEPRLRSQVPTHSAFRKRLCESLRRLSGIDVIVDDDIPVARRWRDFLFDVVANCSAAVVLVNEQALYHSPWVDTEIKIFGTRALNEKDSFRLIVIPFGGITEKHIAKHPSWEPIAVTEWQMLPRTGLDE